MSHGDRGDSFARVYRAVREIPSGCVATYGDISRDAFGHPRAARTVGWALRALPDDLAESVPWWRVVNAAGRISTGRPGGASQEGDTAPTGRAPPCVSEQQRRLEDEGVAFDESGALDLDAHRWRG
jgi:methylated-DNA-protein-cysteine methyltransferase-like protein